MSARSELDQLVWICGVGSPLEIAPFETRHIHQYLFRSQMSRQRGDHPFSLQVAGCRLHAYRTGHGSAFHISDAYSLMVRSLENFPELPMFRTALRAQSSG